MANQNENLDTLQTNPYINNGNNGAKCEKCATCGANFGANQSGFGANQGANQSGFGANQNANFGANQNNFSANQNTQNTTTSAISSFFNSGNSQTDFLKGAFIGVVATFILTNKDAQKAIFKGFAKISSLFEMGIEELKERYEDAKAEVDSK
ncbi:YtxH domain-containing protein [Helicobacter sp. 23-1045]